MKINKLHTLTLACGIAVLALVGSACSTTSKLGSDETLYTGVRKFDVTSVDNEKLPAGLMENLNEAINCKPNNPMPFMSPFKRTPFPIGLWVYNHWSDSSSGIKGWLYRKLVS